MPFVDKSFRSGNFVRPNRSLSLSHAPMGDERYHQLMSEMRAAFAQIDDGEEKRTQAREQEHRHAQWLAQREAVLHEILAAMQRHGLSPEDLA